jgi:hypothetical protein
MNKILLGILVLFVLNGCATNSAIIKSDAEINPEKGVILASVTKRGGTDVWFYYKKDDQTEEQRMDAVGFVWAKEPDDYPDDRKRNGRLLAFEAEEGTYFLTRWQIYVYMGSGYKYISPKDPVPLKFTVKSGEITYLGNLHVDVIDGKNIFGFSIPVAGKSIIENREEIDLELLKQKYPNIDALPVRIEIPDRSKWKI